MIQVSDLSLIFTESGSGQPNPVIEGLNLNASRGESLSIIGPSGCGKSSLLFILAGLITPTSGSAIVDGEIMTEPRKYISLILQESGMLPWKTVWENAMLGPSVNQANREERLREAISELGIEGMEDRFPAQLSGGEKRRVALARALAQDAHHILMDEPLAALDALTKESTQNLILDLWKNHKFTLILVTHDIEEAVFLGQKILIFAPRPTHVAHEIENPGMGEVSYRDTPEFFEKAREIRGLLKNGK